MVIITLQYSELAGTYEIVVCVCAGRDSLSRRRVTVFYYYWRRRRRRAVERITTAVAVVTSSVS